MDGARYQPVAESIAHHLRRAIIDGQLKPGERIKQEALALDRGTSRIPVREALRQLQSEGLVVLVPHRGASVSRFDPAEAHETYLLREQCEALAIAESAPRLSVDQLRQLRELAERLASLSHQAAVRDPAAWLDLDRRFHLLSYSAAPLPRVLRLIEELWNTTQKYRRVIFRFLTAREAELIHAQHFLLVDALEERDAVDAARLQTAHIRRARLRLAARRDLFTMDESADVRHAEPVMEAFEELGELQDRVVP